MNDDAPVTSNDAIEPRESADGLDGSDEKSNGVFTLSDAIAYSASDVKKVPPSSVDEAARLRPLAPSTACSSYTELPLCSSPSASKKAM